MRLPDSLHEALERGLIPPGQEQLAGELAAVQQRLAELPRLRAPGHLAAVLSSEIAVQAGLEGLKGRRLSAPPALAEQVAQRIAEDAHGDALARLAELPRLRAPGHLAALAAHRIARSARPERAARSPWPSLALGLAACALALAWWLGGPLRDLGRLAGLASASPWPAQLGEVGLLALGLLALRGRLRPAVWSSGLALALALLALGLSRSAPGVEQLGGLLAPLFAPGLRWIALGLLLLTLTARLLSRPSPPPSWGELRRGLGRGGLLMGLFWPTWLLLRLNPATAALASALALGWAAWLLGGLEVLLEQLGRWLGRGRRWPGLFWGLTALAALIASLALSPLSGWLWGALALPLAGRLLEPVPQLRPSAQGGEVR